MTQRSRAGFARTFKMQGVSELQRSLNQLPDKLRDNAMKNAAAAGARLIRDEAKRLVPVDTGNLRDDIVVARQVKVRGMRRKLKIAGRVFLGIRGDSRFYSHLVEFGSSRLSPRPFFRPALDAMAPQALKVIGEKLAKEIHRAAGKLSGWKSKKDIKRLTR